MRAGKTMDPNTMNNVGATMGEAAFYGGIIAVVLGIIGRVLVAKAKKSKAYDKCAKQR
jgi:hypothetical protein